MKRNEKIAEILNSKLVEAGANAKAQAVTYPKTNRTVEAVSIALNVNSKLSCGPTIDVNVLPDDPETAAESLFVFFQQIMDDLSGAEKAVHFLQEKENVVSGLTIHLLNEKKNADLMESAVWRFSELEGLVEALYCNLDESTMAVVTPALLKDLKINEEEAFQYALENDERDAKISLLEDMVAALEKKTENKDDPVSPEKAKPIPMYLVTNHQMKFGAGVVVLPSVRRKLAEICQGDFYVLPSSVHETIILPVTEDVEPGALFLNVSTINANEVEPEHVLADALYRYDHITGEFEDISAC